MNADKRGDVKFDFSGMRVLVTGGTSGIGKEIASQFRSAGATVTITGTRNIAAEYQSEDLLQYGYIQLDLGDPESIAAAASQVSDLDILVNNGGGTGGASAPFDFDTSVYVNLSGVYHLTESLVPLLEAGSRRNSASVVNIASEMSLFGSPYFPGYGAAKAGIVQLTKTMAAMYADRGIRCNAVLPGSVTTPMTEMFSADSTVHEAVSARTPLKRWGETQEIASAVQFLSSQGAGFITGHTLVVDGGYSVVDS